MQGDIDLGDQRAFAAVALRFLLAMDLSPDRVSVNSAIASVTRSARPARDPCMVLDELERRELNTALVTLCIGAGMGTATIIERV
jgi:acetyl-CoA C-acetyltransferase